MEKALLEHLTARRFTELANACEDIELSVCTMASKQRIIDRVSQEEIFHSYMLSSFALYSRGSKCTCADGDGDGDSQSTHQIPLEKSRGEI